MSKFLFLSDVSLIQLLNNDSFAIVKFNLIHFFKCYRSTIDLLCSVTHVITKYMYRHLLLDHTNLQLRTAVAFLLTPFRDISKFRIYFDGNSDIHCI